MAALGSAAVAWPVTAHAQQSMPVIGHLTATPELAQRTLAGFRKGLAELGFVEGQNFRFLSFLQLDPTRSKTALSQV
jgi:hypothetical protein